MVCCDSDPPMLYIPRRASWQPRSPSKKEKLSLLFPKWPSMNRERRREEEERRKLCHQPLPGRIQTKYSLERVHFLNPLGILQVLLLLLRPLLLPFSLGVLQQREWGGTLCFLCCCWLRHAGQFFVTIHNGIQRLFCFRRRGDVRGRDFPFFGTGNSPFIFPIRF